MSAADDLQKCYVALLLECTADTPKRMRERLQSVAPVDSGELRDSIEVRQTADFEWTATTRAPQAFFTEAGTRPHKIRPKGKQALFWAGALHPVKEVDHPGSTKHVGWWSTAFDGIDIFEAC